METTTNKETITFGQHTIVKDYDKYTVIITKPSPRSRMGIKVVAHYSFRYNDISKSIMTMNLFVDKFIQTETNTALAKEQAKTALAVARKNFNNPYVIGQILYNSWGYDQTNVDFYQVTKTEGKTVFVCKVAQHATESENMSGKTMPVKDSFIGEEIKKVIQVRMYNNKTSSYIKGLSEWDGQPKYYSSYH